MRGYPRRIRASLLVGGEEYKLWARRLSRYPNEGGLIEYALYAHGAVQELPISFAEYRAKRAVLWLDKVPAKSAMRVRFRPDEDDDEHPGDTWFSA